MTSFVFFFMCGVQPPFTSMVETGDGDLIYLMALSPIRWAQGFLQWEHMKGSRDAQYMNRLMFLENELVLDQFGLVLSVNFTCDGSDTIRDRWLGHSWGKPVSFSCSTVQLFLLGVCLRFGGVLSMLAISKIQSTGGGALFEGRNRAVSSEIFMPVINLLFWTCLIVLANAELNLMLLTH